MRRTTSFLATNMLSAFAIMLAPAHAADHSSTADTWVASGRTLDNVATIYLGTTFSQKAGTFKAMPESMLDKHDHISGNFLVGTFRKVFDEPTEDMHGVAYNESITTELIDCDNDYFGTLRQIRKLQGQVVVDEITSDDEIDMIQSHITGIDGALCDLYQGNARPSIAPVPNPDYNPHPTEQDYHKLVEKYLPSAAKSPPSDNNH